LFAFNKEAKLIKETKFEVFINDEEKKLVANDLETVLELLQGHGYIIEKKIKKGVDFLGSNDYNINISAKGDRYDHDKRNERL
tara:strand:- start:2478 stop:2726 length:249 start_codon:yes stop_codon:yes gene_type:complete